MDQPDSPDDDPFVFTPVATAARSDGWTADRQRRFIAELAQHGGVSAAARSVGMTPQTANRLRKRPGAEGFARAWDAAIEEGGAIAGRGAGARDGGGGRSRHARRQDHRPPPPLRQPPALRPCYGEPMGRFGNSERR